MSNPTKLNFDFTELKNITTEMAEELKEMCICDLEDMKMLGAEELFVLYFETFGLPQEGKDKTWIFSIEGAIANIDWCDIPDFRKEDLEIFLYDFRNKFVPKIMIKRGAYNNSCSFDIPL